MPVVNRIEPQSNKCATGAENKAIGVSKLHDSPGQRCSFSVDRFVRSIECWMIET